MGPVVAALLLSSCITTAAPEKRAVSAQSAAQSAGLTRQVVPGGGFDLTIFSRINAPGQAARVYIEGDGLAWIGRYKVSADPTPTEPVALRLAAADLQANPGQNVIYMARPCQYSSGPACQKDYWTGKRFAPEVISAMDAALSRVTDAGQVNGVELVGFSGGGAVAALLAAQRPDVVNLRTVAGNLDHRAHSRIHNVSLLAGSLNPPDRAARLQSVPQYHFTGAQDKNVTSAVYEAYAAQLGDRKCVRHQVVPGVSHEEGWAAAWAALLAEPIACR
ncbi:MAG: alpha/beta hydrolase [Alphaproteobacteria bacterium]|nr:alpha/beta hydrolase [Alphaproteobacteria bacterium]